MSWATAGESSSKADSAVNTQLARVLLLFLFLASGSCRFMNLAPA